MSVIVSKIDEWAVEACDEPVFLIRILREGKADLFYRVLAHWEFDAEAATEEQKECCQEVAELFQRVKASSATSGEVIEVQASALTPSALSRRPCTTCPPPKSS